MTEWVSTSIESDMQRSEMEKIAHTVVMYCTTGDEYFYCYYYSNMVITATSSSSSAATTEYRLFPLGSHSHWKGLLCSIYSNHFLPHPVGGIYVYVHVQEEKEGEGFPNGVPQTPTPAGWPQRPTDDEDDYSSLLFQLHFYFHFYSEKHH